MRFRDSIFGRLLEPINRRQFQTVVDDQDGDAYDKSFKSWDHLVALIYAQLSGADGLRGLVAGFMPILSTIITWVPASCRDRRWQMPMPAVRSVFLHKPLQGCQRWRTDRCDAKERRWCA